MNSSARLIARRVLRPPMYEVARSLWRMLRKLKNWAQKFLIGSWLLATRFELPNVLFRFGFTPGDDLLCTAVLWELRKRGQRRLWMISDYPELFAGVGDAAHTIPATSSHRVTRVFRGRCVHLEYASMLNGDRSTSPRRHIIAELCARAGVSGSVELRPHLILTKAEISAAGWASGRIVIQSSGLAAKYPMRNKQWFPERFQSVVDSLSDEFAFVQLGAAADPALEHVRDLRGGTDIRQAAAILHHARLYIGNVGFLMHLARAVECPSVVVYGGREAPWQSGYICNMNLFTQLPCSPCWRWNTCDYDHKCMIDITADEVTRAVRAMLERARNPLALEHFEIKAGEA